MILHKTTGEFNFLVKEGNKYKQVNFTDLRDIPEDFEFDHVVKFRGDYPEPPHTVQDHERIAYLETVFKQFMEKERARRN